MPLPGVPAAPHPRSLCPCVLGGTPPQQSLVGTRRVREEVPGADAARQDFPEGSVWDLVGGRGPVGIPWCPETCRGVKQTQQQFGGQPCLVVAVPSLSPLSWQQLWTCVLPFLLFFYPWHIFLE